MKLLLILGVAFLGSSGFYPEPFNDPVPLNQGIKSAIKGVAKHVYVKKHDFTIHAVKIKTAGTSKTITGQISHRLTWRPDDEFYYTIIKENNVVKEITHRIKYNEIKRVKDWIKESSLFKQLITYVTGVPGDQVQNKLTEFEKEFDKLTKGKNVEWEEAAQFIVSNIALRAN